VTETLLQMRDIHKAFGATRALSGVHLEVQQGQVHILVGENGAGKSTLMKILTGVHKPDRGEILLEGAPFQAHNPRHAQNAGIAMIYQEFNLALHLPVYANIFLGHEIKKTGVVRQQEEMTKTREIFQRLNCDIDPAVPVLNLGVAQRQLVEIARALSVNAKLIIMDEPTAALSEQEARQLFNVIRTLQQQGVGIIYISHYLEEFNQIGDVYTVLRDGQFVGSGPIDSTTPEQLINMMVGRDIDELYPKSHHIPGDVIFRVNNLSSPNGTKHVSLEVSRGEIVGIAGLVGAGRTEMLRALFGLDPSQVQELAIGHVTVLSPSPRRLLRHGVGLLSEDRGGEGLAQTMTIATNITLSIPKKVSRWGVLNFEKCRQISCDVMSRVNIRAESPEQKVNQLSGGNQQKVAIARLLGADTNVLLLDEPTRGIDVGSKSEIYRIIDQLAAQGKGVVMVSSYLPEIFGMCDSVYVMSRGSLSRKFAISEINADQVMALATGLVNPAVDQVIDEEKHVRNDSLT
jgi:ribose transport system ATP-binding protein